MEKSKKQITLGTVINIIMIAMSVIWFGVFVVINLQHRDINNSDIAQTGIYSRAVWESGTLVPKGFFAWSESGIFSLGLLGAPVYGLTKSIWAAQTIPPVIISALILVAVIYLLKGLEITKDNMIFFITFLLSFPISAYVQSMTFLFYAAYAQVVLTLFWILGDYVRIMEGKLAHEKLHMCLQFLIAFLQGCNSSRGVLMVYAPLLLLQLVRCVFLFFQKKHVGRQNWKLLCYCTICLVISYATTYAPWSVRAHAQLHIRGTLQHFVKNIIPSILGFVGVRNNPNYFLKLVIITVFLLSALVLIFRIAKASESINNKICNALVCCWFSLGITIVMLTLGRMDTAGRYFLTAIYIAAFSLVWLFQHPKISKQAVYAFKLVFIIYACINLYKNFLPSIYSEGGEYTEISNWMQENAYKYGYAEYIDANGMTVSVDGEVQISGINMNDLTMCRWVTDESWYPPALDENLSVVYIIRKENLELFADNLDKYEDIILKYETENYLVFASDKNHTRQ